WTARPLVEAFPDDTAPRYLLRDRDAISDEVFTLRVTHMGIRAVRIAPHSPWQNPFRERLIGSIRRDCLDHFLILNEAHLRRRLHADLGDSNISRPRHALAHNSPRPRDAQPPALG